MATVDNATWQALGLTLTLLGLAVSALVWRRRGAPSGLRAVAWSLLPLAAALTGTLRLAWRIADAVVDWAVRLVFSPAVWAGIALAGLAVALFVVAGILRSRSGAGAGRKDEQTAGRPAQGRSVQGRPAVGDDDLADIEALLRKHGIE